jgi:hypothetical protein
MQLIKTRSECSQQQKFKEIVQGGEGEQRELIYPAIVRQQPHIYVGKPHPPTTNVGCRLGAPRVADMETREPHPITNQAPRFVIIYAI